MAATSKLNASERVSAGIDLLQLLTRASGHRLRVEDACAGIGITEDQLADIVDTLSILGDTASGARVALTLSSGVIALHGDAASLRPIRLGDDEAAALSHVLHELNIDEDLQQRVADALLPLGFSQVGIDQIADTVSHGLYYQHIVEAIEDGARCSILYRSSTEREPRRRLIDPWRIKGEEASSYLLAWDLELDEQRSYRLDRIADFQLTDDSVTSHPFEDASIKQQLERSGTWVDILFADVDTAQGITWAGLDRASMREDGDGRVHARVAVASEPWLFCQVLSLGGRAVIEGPAEMKTRLRDFARNLVSTR